MPALGLFAGLDDDERAQLAREMRRVTIPAGEDVMVRGEGGVGFMVLLEGVCEVETAAGRHRTLHPGDHFGEMALLLSDVRSATVVTKTDSVVTAVPEWEFRQFLARHPDLSLRLMRVLASRLLECEQRER